MDISDSIVGIFILLFMMGVSIFLYLERKKLLRYSMMSCEEAHEKGFGCYEESGTRGECSTDHPNVPIILGSRTVTRQCIPNDIDK